MRSSSLMAGGLCFGIAAASLYNETTDNHTCVIEPTILSCSAEANAMPPSIPTIPPNEHVADNPHRTVDTCCTETSGGLVLSTQYWDTYTGLESQGQLIPPKQWTLHGLWPDFCNGSYTQYCDLSRQFDPSPSPNVTNYPRNGTVVPPYSGPGVDTFIESFGKYDLLAYMNKYWINQGGTNEEFWAHEFSKHATCYSTFDVPCYGPKYVEHQEVIEFYETAIMYYQGLPSYTWLADKGIVPSNSTTYTLSDIQAALTEAYGAIPYVGCSGPSYNHTAAGKGTLDDGYTNIDELWYYHHVYGRPQDYNYVVVNATAPDTSCATSPGAINYFLRTTSSLETS